MSGRPWTDEERDVLRLLAARGHGPSTMAQVLKGRTPEAIRCQLETLGIVVALPPPEIDYELLRTLTDD